MSDQSEIERIRQGGLDPHLPPAKWEFEVDLGDSPDDVWERIISVVKHVVTYDYDTWPADEYWRERMPPWLMSAMMTLEEARLATSRIPRERWHELPWEFGSWLDAMRERDWKWWGSQRSGRRGRIVLSMTGIPPRIDALKQILLAAGAKILSEIHD